MSSFFRCLLVFRLGGERKGVGLGKGLDWIGLC